MMYWCHYICALLGYYTFLRHRYIIVHWCINQINYIFLCHFISNHCINTSCHHVMFYQNTNIFWCIDIIFICIITSWYIYIVMYLCSCYLYHHINIIITSLCFDILSHLYHYLVIRVYQYINYHYILLHLYMIIFIFIYLYNLVFQYTYISISIYLYLILH